jgi:hypothetical protein
MTAAAKSSILRASGLAGRLHGCLGMGDDQAISPAHLIEHLLEHQGRQAESMDKLATAAQAIAESLHTMVATSLTAALVYPWTNDLSVVRVVLLRSAEDQRRLQESLARFETSDRSMPMEEWLKKEDFTLLATTQMNLHRKGIGTFKATAAHTGLSAPEARPLDAPPKPLEMEHPST